MAKAQRTMAIVKAKTIHQTFNLGSRLRQLRESRQWTVAELAERATLARSTISKIERGQMSPTFDLLQRLVGALEIEWGALVHEGLSPAGGPGRRSLTRMGEGRFVDIPNYRHELLCADMIRKGFVPMRTSVQARLGDQAPDLVSHRGEEFVYILEGEVECHTEFYEPLRLRQGDSLYYDSEMAHAFVSVSPKDAVMLWVAQG